MVAAGARTREQILDSAIPLVGQFGLKKTSVNDLARAAGLSKQGLYLHFATKEELIAAAFQRYCDEGLRLTKEALDCPTLPLNERLVDALDAWFGRHFVHFKRSSLEFIEPANRPASSAIDSVKQAYCALLEGAIARAPAAERGAHVCTPAELSRVLFQFGLTWKEGHASREAFRRTLYLCVAACFPSGHGGRPRAAHRPR
jgi:TetR/AcrR family transcriptional regulator, regulator of autoinduction and epiphytic fitness